METVLLGTVWALLWGITLVRISPWWRRYRAKQLYEEHQQRKADQQKRMAELERAKLWGGAVPKPRDKDAYYSGDGDLHPMFDRVG
jgi:hypothetical protein